VSIPEKRILTSYPCFQFDTYATWLPDDSLVLGSNILFSRVSGNTYMVCESDERDESDESDESDDIGVRGEEIENINNLIATFTVEKISHIKSQAYIQYISFSLFSSPLLISSPPIFSFISSPLFCLTSEYTYLFRQLCTHTHLCPQFQCTCFPNWITSYTPQHSQFGFYYKNSRPKYSPTRKRPDLER
jgi:hypothetical protein